MSKKKVAIITGGGGFFGGSGLSGIVLDFSLSEESFLSLIKSTTLNEFSVFRTSEPGLTIYANSKKIISGLKEGMIPDNTTLLERYSIPPKLLDYLLKFSISSSLNQPPQDEQ